MIITTTPSIEGHPIKEYIGIVSAEAIIGANCIRDMFASIRDVFGGRSGSYEEVMLEGKENAIDELQQRAEAWGANAIVGVHLSYEAVGKGNSMFMVVAVGTAVII